LIFFIWLVEASHYKENCRRNFQKPFLNQPQNPKVLPTLKKAPQKLATVFHQLCGKTCRNCKLSPRDPGI
jgi:hypothetical protein